MEQNGGLLALAARLERRRSLLGFAKLANVGLAMVWGFAVTFVFVRLLSFQEFRAFLLLVAFANFTISAELGFSTVIYSRLRRTHLSGKGGFRNEELGVLLLFMIGIVGIGALLIGGGLAGGLIRTVHPLLFLVFYATSALNLIALLARRALAALDHNLWWETLDFLRRAISLALLLAALLGLPILTSVFAQFIVVLAVILFGLFTVQRELAMSGRDWLALRSGWEHVRANYLGDIGRTSLLTMSDIAAYNAPYFTIVAVTQDARPLLLFDFIFKMSRALSAVVRALVETVLPDLTKHFHAAEMALFRAQLQRCLLLCLGVALALGLALLVAGPILSSLMFNGRIKLNHVELAIILALLAGLSLICVSVYIQNGLGRFSPLVVPSLIFLCGSLASVPVAAWIGQWINAPFALRFVSCYALVHVVLAIVHGRMLARLGKPLRP